MCSSARVSGSSCLSDNRQRRWVSDLLRIERIDDPGSGRAGLQRRNPLDRMGACLGRLQRLTPVIRAPAFGRAARTKSDSRERPALL